MDPKGAILADIYNICRTNARVPSAWKHSTVTLLHKGGEPAELKNWRTVSVQLTVYKLYAAIIAKRIASWATATSSFSPAQKGFLAYDGCGVHNFLLRSILGDSRREKNLLLAWLDIKDAFPSVSHHLMLFFMERVGLSGSVLRVVQDIYSHATVAIRTGRESRTPPIPQRRGVKQGCLLSPILFNVVIEGLLRHLSASQGGYSIARYIINTLAYADDVCVIASSKTKMQSLLDRCAEFGIGQASASTRKSVGQCAW